MPSCLHTLPLHVRGLADAKVCSRFKAVACSSTYNTWRWHIFIWTGGNPNIEIEKNAMDWYLCGLLTQLRRGEPWPNSTDSLRTLSRDERETDRRGHKRREKKGSSRKGMKGNVRERGNGRLDGNSASVKERERERTQEGGEICLAQMESIFAPFPQSCARVQIKAGRVCSEKGAESQRRKRLTSLQSDREPRETLFH